LASNSSEDGSGEQRDKFLVIWQAFRPSTFILFSTLVVAFCFAGRSINSIPARPADRWTPTYDSVTDDIRKIELQAKEALITGDTMHSTDRGASPNSLRAPSRQE